MNILIKNTNALVMGDNNKYCTRQTDIAISGEKIIAVGEAPVDFVPQEIIDGSNYITIPGLINCHTHSYMSLFRDLADDLCFEDWLFANVDPLEGKLTNDDAYKGALLSCVEMIKTGTTCFMDMHMFRNMTAMAADETGMRAVMTRGIVGGGANDDATVRRVNDTIEEIKRWGNNDRFTFMIAPHAIYTCHEEAFRYCTLCAKEYNIGIHTHLCETKNEVENCKKEHNGMTPVEYLENIGVFEVNTCAAHCVYLTENDMDILKRRNVTVIHNPKSNLKLGNGIANIPAIYKKGINIAMGTDSQASNNTVNMFSDMNFAAMIHKGTTLDPTMIGANDVIKFATVNGAKALGIDAGEIAVGKKADLAMLNLNTPGFCPANDLVSALCYSANGTETDHVIINGELVMKDRVVLGVDEEKLYFEVNEILKRIKA